MTQALNPLGPGAITSALGWVEGTLLGTFASIIAVIAVASVGLLMLTGRIDVRRAAQVILGCFLLFGALSIAAGIQATAAAAGGGSHESLPQPDFASPPSPPLPRAQARAAPQPFDPYAGAAVPSQ